MKMMPKFIFLKKYIPFTIAIILHLIVLSFFLEKPRELVYPDVTTPKPGITFNLKSNFKINYIGTPNKNDLSSKKPIQESKKILASNSTKASNNMAESSSTNNSSNKIGLAGNSENSFKSSDFINYEEPTYPRLAREKNIQGKFAAKIYFGINGTVEKIEFVETTGSKILEESISSSIKKWKVKTNSPYSIIKKFEFKLND